MANANPFLFGDQAPASNEPPNPFLGMGQAAPPSAMAANPFMTAQPAQGGFYPGQAFAPQPSAEAANPFATPEEIAAAGVEYAANAYYCTVPHGAATDSRLRVRHERFRVSL